MARVLLPLPDRDFDPTEAAVPFTLLREAGHEIVVATASGARAHADPRVLDGVIFGQLGASRDAVARYATMCEDRSYDHPVRWEDVGRDDFDALLLPGGHAQGMRPYLESLVVQELARQAMSDSRPVAAICHGVVVLARAKDVQGRSLLHGRRTTCLPKYMERLAYYLTAWKLGRYYRTYPAYVEDEVRSALGESGRFVRGPVHLVRKGTLDDDAPAFVLEDGNYLSARWPGDAYLLAKRLLEKLDG